MSPRDGFAPLPIRTAGEDPSNTSLLGPLRPSGTDRPSNARSRSSSTLLSPVPRYPQPDLPPLHHFPPSPLSSSPTQTAPLPRYLALLPLSRSTLQLIHANTGLLLVASSQIFFVAMGLSAKYFVSSTSISTLTLIFVRMGMTALLSLAWLFFTNHPNPALGPPDPRIRRLLMLRGFFGFGGLFANYQSFRGLSVSDSVTIQFLAPNLTAALGWAVLGETLGWREVTAGAACLGGVVLVSRPPFLFGVSDGGVAASRGSDELRAGIIPGEGADAGITHADRMLAVGWAFVSVTFATCAYVTIRKIGKQAHALHSMLYFCYACLITTFIGLLINIRSFVFIQTWKEFWLIMLIGTFGFIAQILLTFGLQREKAGRASLAMYLSLFYSLVFELLFFGTVPPFLSLLGAFIIISSAIWVAVSKKTDDPSDLHTTPQGRYTRVATDEESLDVSLSSSPMPLDGASKRGEAYDYSNPVMDDEGRERNGTFKQDEGGNAKDEVDGGKLESGSGLGRPDQPQRLGPDGRVLRRRSSALSSGK